MTKLRAVCAAAILAATASGTAYADASANIGIMSDYIFRGVYVSDASAFAGVDIEAESGFYLGAWGADIQNGLEYDVYLGVQRGNDNIQWGVGLTGYYFSDADLWYNSPELATSEEINFNFSYGFLTLDVALGDYKNPLTGGEEQTYTYYGWTFAPDIGPYYFIGKNDFHEVNGFEDVTGADGYWIEIGKSFEIMEDLEISVAGLYTPDAANPGDAPGTMRAVNLSGTNPFAEFAAVVTLTKTIQIGD